MSGVTIVVELVNFAAAQAAISRFADLDEAALLTVVGGIGEMQTRRRIEEEKTSPNGAAWAPNQEGTSILLRTGEHLRDSIAFIVGGSEVQWGSSWEFAHVHQYGAVIVPKEAEALVFQVRGRTRRAQQVTIPAREFVGLSADNGREIEEVVTDFLGGLAA